MCGVKMLEYQDLYFEDMEPYKVYMLDPVHCQVRIGDRLYVYRLRLSEDKRTGYIYENTGKDWSQLVGSGGSTKRASPGQGLHDVIHAMMMGWKKDDKYKKQAYEYEQKTGGL